LIASLITAGGVLFWILTAIAFLALVVEINSNKVGSAFVTLLAYAAVIVLLSDIPVWTWIKANPLYILYGFAAYVGAGAVWSVIKWWFYLLNMRDRYETLRSDWLGIRNLKEVPVNDPVQYQTFKEQVVAKVDYRHSFPPVATEHKGKITTWMTFWPFSLVDTILGDFLARVFKTVHAWLAGLMQRISNGVFGKYAELN
jgi:hypothetical protein